MEVKCYPCRSRRFWNYTFFACFCHRRQPQNKASGSMHIKTLRNRQNAVGFLETYSQTHVIWTQKVLVNDAWLEHVCVTGLSGADWQSKNHVSVWWISQSHLTDNCFITGLGACCIFHRKEKETKRWWMWASENIRTHKKRRKSWLSMLSMVTAFCLKYCQNVKVLSY